MANISGKAPTPRPVTLMDIAARLADWASEPEPHLMAAKKAELTNIVETGPDTGPAGLADESPSEVKRVQNAA